MEAPFKPQCALCGAEKCEDGKTLKKCGVCLKVNYCSKAHQRTHWKAQHKTQCAMVKGNGYTEFSKLYLREFLELKTRECKDPRDLFLCGEVYRYGVYVQQDVGKAIEYYTKAADAGNALAHDSLGHIYANGEGILKEDQERAVFHWQQSVALGDPDGRSQYNLGVYFERGIGVKLDLVKALEHYHKSAKKGDSLAMDNLGVFYLDGKGCRQDTVAAFQYFKQAAEKGLASGLFNLGWCYENGSGTRKDLAKAVACYKQSADGGSDKAREEWERAHRLLLRMQGQY